MATIAPILTRTTPLRFPAAATRPASPARPAADRVALSAPEPPQRPEPQAGPSGVALALVAGGLALAGVGALAGTLGGAGQVQPSELQPESLRQEASRDAEPISQEQWARMKQIGSLRPEDNASARQVKESYLEVAQEMLTEADYFRAQAQSLEQEGQRLEYLGRELGNGSHQLQGDSLEVALRSDGISVTLRSGETTRSLVRDGHTSVVEVNDGQGPLRLEDTATSRSVSEGQTTRTLYLQDSLLHQAGEFEVQTASRSVQQTTRVAGTTVVRHLEQMVSGYAGTESIVSTQRWEKPEVAIALYPGTVLSYRETRSSQNLSLQSETQSFRDVEVRQDGSTRVKHNHTLQGTDLETIEPAESANPTVIR